MQLRSWGIVHEGGTWGCRFHLEHFTASQISLKMWWKSIISLESGVLHRENEKQLKNRCMTNSNAFLQVLDRLSPSVRPPSRIVIRSQTAIKEWLWLWSNSIHCLSTVLAGYLIPSDRQTLLECSNNEKNIVLIRRKLIHLKLPR